MTFPNAHNGLKKVLTAEILSVVSGFLLLLTGTFTAVAAALAEKSAVTDDTEAVLALISLGLLIAFSAVGILSIILKIVGLKKAGNDEAVFRNALIAALVSLALSVFEMTLNALSRQPVSLRQRSASVTFSSSSLSSRASRICPRNWTMKRWSRPDRS